MCRMRRSSSTTPRSTGSLEVVRDEFAGVRLITLSENRGFAGGVGEGIRAAKGEWVLCINNDATVDTAAVAELLRTADEANEDVGSIAALMVFADRRDLINSARIEVDSLGVAWDRHSRSTGRERRAACYRGVRCERRCSPLQALHARGGAVRRVLLRIPRRRRCRMARTDARMAKPLRSREQSSFMNSRPPQVMDLH